MNSSLEMLTLGMKREEVVEKTAEEYLDKHYLFKNMYNRGNTTPLHFDSWNYVIDITLINNSIESSSFHWTKRKTHFQTTRISLSNHLSVNFL